jgi:DNA-binding beta-propeller fold protein YncE
VGISGRRRLTAGVALLVVSCGRQPATVQPAAPETKPERIAQIPLPGSGYVYDVAVGAGAVWVTSHGGLYRIDPATRVAVNVLHQDYLFRVALGHGAVWISAGSDGRVMRIDPDSNTVTAVVDVGAGPVTSLAISEDAVWASANSDLVEIDLQRTRWWRVSDPKDLSAKSHSPMGRCGSSPERAGRARC